MNDIRMTSLYDADELFEFLRPSDVAEAEAISSRPILDRIEEAIMISSSCKSLFIGGHLASIWGVADVPSDPTGGIPWMLGTELINEHPRMMARESVIQLSLMMDQYEFLRQFIYVQNEASIRWLRWLGFKFLEARVIGPKGSLFYPFEYRRNV